MIEKTLLLESMIISVCALSSVNLLAGWLRYDRLKSIYKRVNKDTLFDLTEKPNYLESLKHPLKNLRYGMFGMIGASPE